MTLRATFWSDACQPLSPAIALASQERLLRVGSAVAADLTQAAWTWADEDARKL